MSSAELLPRSISSCFGSRKPCLSCSSQRIQSPTRRTRLALGILTSRLEQRRKLSREEATTWEEALARKEAELAERQAQMERRYHTLEKAEASARRRTAELDELEDRLNQEFERQERQLAKERRQLERLRAQLRVQGLLSDDNPETEAMSLGG